MSLLGGLVALCLSSHWWCRVVGGLAGAFLCFEPHPATDGVLAGWRWAATQGEQEDEGGCGEVSVATWRRCPL
ncbi:MAG: hypothetical protein QXS27_08830 [Candidatus Jordarchaeaceae archaeon]